MPLKSSLSVAGIYVSSNVPGSTRAWDCKVQNNLVGKNGNIEHVREFLPGEGEMLKPHQVYLMSDRTPYEDLPMKETTTRQFFRIIASEVRFWFKDLYTANPLGVLPDPRVTDIVLGNEFPDSEEEIQIVNDWKEQGFEQVRIIEKRVKVEQKRKRRYMERLMPCWLRHQSPVSRSDSDSSLDSDSSSGWSDSSDIQY